MMQRRQFLAGLAAAGSGVAWAGSSLDFDAALRLRGRRTFPLILYQPPQSGSREAGLLAAKEAGFDVVRCEPAREALDEVAEAGLMGWCAVGSIPRSRDVADRHRIESLVQELKGHPALAWWETEDEPSFQWKKPLEPRVAPEAIRETYALLKRLDPSRLVYLNHAPTNLVSTLRQYNPGGDIVATDVYPVIPSGIRSQYALWPDGRQGDLLNAHISQVGEYADKMRTVAGRERAVFMVLQAFAWEMLRKEGDRDAKSVLYPTGDQLRFMACQSIVHGANGLVWWGLQYTPAASGLWPELAKLATLLRALEPALLAPSAKGNIALDYHDTGHSLDRGVEWTLREESGQRTWIAVNADPNPVDVTVRGLPARAEVVAGVQPVREGAEWRARFAPFDTGIWRMR